MAMLEKKRAGPLVAESGRNSMKAEKKAADLMTEEQKRAADLKAVREILATRIGGYSGTVLPDGTRID
jgi:transposase